MLAPDEGRIEAPGDPWGVGCDLGGIQEVPDGGHGVGQGREQEDGIEAAKGGVDIEDELLGSNHAEIGGALLGDWGLPQVVTTAIAYHDDLIYGIQDYFHGKIPKSNYTLPSTNSRSR